MTRAQSTALSTWSTPSFLCSIWKTSLMCHFHIHTPTTFKSTDWSPRNNATAGHPSLNGLVSEQQYYQNGSIFVPCCEATLMTVYKHRLTCIACVMHVKIAVFWDAKLCSLLDSNYCFRATCSLYQEDAQIKQACLKYMYMFTRLTWHHIPPHKFLVIYQKTKTKPLIIQIKLLQDFYTIFSCRNYIIFHYK